MQQPLAVAGRRWFVMRVAVVLLVVAAPVQQLLQGLRRYHLLHHIQECLELHVGQRTLHMLPAALLLRLLLQTATISLIK